MAKAKQEFLLLLDHNDNISIWMKNPDGFEVEVPVFGKVDAAIRKAYDFVPLPADQQIFETYTVITLQKKSAEFPLPETEPINGQ